MTDFEQYKVEAPAGINFAREPSQLNPQLWDSGDNVSFRHGKSMKSEGYEEGFGRALSRPECIVPLREGDQNYYWWLYAGNTIDGIDKIYKITSKDSHEDITPDGGIHTQSPFYLQPTWTGDSVNSIPYLCKDQPYVYEPSTGKMRKMSMFPEHVHFRTMRTYRNFMIGLNFYTDDFDPNDAGAPKGFAAWDAGHHPQALWWSQDVIGSQLDPGIDPQEGAKSMWCDADPTRNSGWNFLGGSGGPIVDGKSMRDGFIIYRERSVWQMSYIGGINVFTFKELFDDAGALGLDCIAEVEGNHFVVGQSDIYIHNGVQKQSVADGVVRKEIFSSIDPDHQDRVFVSVNYNKKELWVNIPEAGTNNNGSCNVAYVYNWEEKHWAKRDVPDITCSTYTILSIAEDDISWDAISEGGPVNNEGVGVDIPGGSWEEATDTWMDSYFKYNPSQWGLVLGSFSPKDKPEHLWDDNMDWNDRLFWVSADRSLYENAIYTIIEEPIRNGENFEATLEKRWIDMGDRTDTSFVNKIYPLVRNGTLDVYMAGSMLVDEGISWKYIGTFDPTRDSKLSCRISGNFVHVKFVIPEKSRAEIRGYWLEFGKIGRRS